MNSIYKPIAAAINFINYVVGIVVAIILLFKKDFISVFYFEGMTSNESLFFNLTMFQLGLLLIGILICFMTAERKKPDQTLEFPVFYEIIPIVITVISIFYGFRGETAREKIIVIVCAILYSVFSAVIVYSGARIFQIIPKEKK